MSDETRQSQSALADGTLLTRAGRGDTDAAGELWTRYTVSAHVYAARLVGADEVEALVEAAYSRSLQAARDGTPPIDFRGQLFETMRSLAVNAGGAELAAAEEAADRIGPQDDLVAQAFYQLDQRHRAALWLTEVEGLTTDQLAQDLRDRPAIVVALRLKAKAMFNQTMSRSSNIPTGTTGQALLRGVVGVTGPEWADDAVYDAAGGLQAVVGPPAAPAFATALAAGLAGAATAGLAGSAGSVSRVKRIEPKVEADRDSGGETLAPADVSRAAATEDQVGDQPGDHLGGSSAASSDSFDDWLNGLGPAWKSPWEDDWVAPPVAAIPAPAVEPWSPTEIRGDAEAGFGAWVGTQPDESDPDFDLDWVDDDPYVPPVIASFAARLDGVAPSGVAPSGVAPSDAAPFGAAPIGAASVSATDARPVGQGLTGAVTLGAGLAGAGVAGAGLSGAVAANQGVGQPTAPTSARASTAADMGAAGSQGPGRPTASTASPVGAQRAGMGAGLAAAGGAAAAASGGGLISRGPGETPAPVTPALLATVPGATGRPAGPPAVPPTGSGGPDVPGASRLPPRQSVIQSAGHDPQALWNDDDTEDEEPRRRGGWLKVVLPIVVILVVAIAVILLLAKCNGPTTPTPTGTPVAPATTATPTSAPTLATTSASPEPTTPSPSESPSESATASPSSSPTASAPPSSAPSAAPTPSRTPPPPSPTPSRTPPPPPPTTPAPTPGIPVQVTAIDAGVQNVCSPQLSGVGQPGDSLTLFGLAPSPLEVTVGGDGSWTTGRVTAFSPGSKQVSIVAGDGSRATALVKQAVPPTVGVSATTQQVSLTASGLPGLRVEFLVDGTLVGSATFNAGGTINTTLPVSLASGSHSLGVRYAPGGCSGALAVVPFSV